ncbi:MAG: redox-sensing transcriptional repressor Rex [Planctomycetes bacterium]|nr:redox-sensing transcriptional repressor Rex [Planctomycetota bacterium]
MPKNAAKVGKIPSIRRLPQYLRVLRGLEGAGQEVASSSMLSTSLGLEQIVVKKDIEITGITGKTGVGYMVAELIDGIEDYLGWNNSSDAFLVGAGSMGKALLGYDGFRRHGLQIVAAFDNDEGKVGGEYKGVPVLPMSKLKSLASRLHVHIAILTVPGDSAQEVASQLADCGISGIWNFAPTTIQVPESVSVLNEDLSASLAELSVRIQSNM